MAVPGTVDLDAIAVEEEAKRKRGTPCWVCSIPEREWVERARKDGRTITVITAVLVRNGHPADKATHYRVRDHLSNHVR